MIKASIIKEFRLIFSDLHSLAVLFLMPISFMLIMTFALSNKAEDLTKSINLNITQQDSNLAESLLKAYLSDVGFSQDINQHAKNQCRNGNDCQEYFFNHRCQYLFF